MKLSDLYDDAPAHDELIWEYVSPEEFGTQEFAVVTVDPTEIYAKWTVDGAGTTVGEAYRRHATKAQKALIAKYRKQKSLPDTTIVVYDTTLLDGYHRIVALALNGVRSVAAIDVGEPIE